MFDGMVSYASKASPATQGVDRSSGRIGWAVAVVGVLVPMLLVAYAFGASADSIQRVQILLEGFKAVIGFLAAIVTLASVFPIAAGSRIGERAAQPA